MFDALTRRRARARTFSLIACAVLVVLASASGSAWAGKGVVGVFGSGGTTEGQFSSAGSVAVNATTGDVDVVDQGNDRVEQFDPTGTFIRTWGWGVSDGSSAFQVCTSSCQAGIAGSGDGQFDGPQGIAIDQSDDSVYVVDGNNARVEKFSSTGAYSSQFGSAGSADGQFTSPQGIAVDPADGSVLVADTSDNRIERFDNTGTYVSQFGSEGSGDGQFEGPTRVAVDSTGRIYVVDSGNSRVERFARDGTFDEVFDPTDVFLPAEIAVDTSNDHVYIAQWAQDFSEQRVVEIDASGTLVDTHGVGSTASNASGLGLSSGAQKIYLADGYNTRVFILGDLTPATVAIDPISNVSAGGATATGTVNPQGTDTGWHFEISTDENNWSAVAGDQDAGSGSSDVPVTQALTGLLPNQTYYVRLVATRQYNAPVASSDVQFTTDAVPATVTSFGAEDITQTHAVLHGFVNPNNAATTYYFDYGTTSNYGTSVPVAQNGDAGASTRTADLLQRIDGLQAGTTYHFRIVAHSVAGTVTGQDRTFTTTSPAASGSCPNDQYRVGPSAALPDCRAYELVSPPDKNGGDVMGDSARTRASAGGDAVSFTSLTGFSDVRGTGAAIEYMSERTGQAGTNGWSTHAITPPQRPMSALALTGGVDPVWSGEFSSDLSHGVFSAWSPLTDDPLVAGVQNLYQRDDLLTPGAGNYQLLTQCVSCGSPLTVNAFSYGDFEPSFAGASADFGQVLFESPFQLTADAPPGGPYLYEWNHGVVTLAGILPDGTAATAAIAARPGAPGRGAYTYRTISTDGRRIFFMSSLGTCGVAVPVACGRLYMRVDNGTPNAQTVMLNRSERTVPGSSRPATFWTATPDGSRIFFTTQEDLTDDATGSATKIYMYDATLPDSDPHNLTLVSVDGELADGRNNVLGVIGASDDGHTVYFAAAGQLVSGGPWVSQQALYAWRDGSTRYLGQSLPVDNPLDLDAGSWIFVSNRFQARVTPDGHHLLFLSHDGSHLVGYDHGNACSPNTDLIPGGQACAELYLYSDITNSVSCVTCNPSGAAAQSDGTDMVRFGTGGAATSSHVSHAMSDDGRYVFFSTRDALVPQDINGKVDAYEYDSVTGEVHLISTGKDPSDSYFLDASADGRNVFFITRQQLVGWDKDTNYDLYDARVNGGVPDPAPSSDCAGDGCQGPAPGAAAPNATPGSSTLMGGGNLPGKLAAPHKAKRPKAVRCKKGYVRKKVRGRVRCVKKRPVRARRAGHGTSKPAAKQSSGVR